MREMREIKFRGRRLNDFKEEKEFVYGQYQKHNLWDGTPKNNVRHAIHYLYLNEHPGCNGHFLNEMEYVSEETIGQYTGLKDMNGVEIYEGDIVEILYNGLGNKIVEFENGKYNISSYNVKHCRIIGNIHQNKELL